MNSSMLLYGDNAWVMTSTGLVYMMTPALACFYGGLVENKNFLNQLFLSFVCMAIIPIQWCLFGYSFVFGPGNSIFGSFRYALTRQLILLNESIDKIDVSSTISFAFICFQCSFATLAPALISGAVVGRMKLIPYMIFIFLWTTLCYDPLTRWIIFKDGWLHKIGVIDFSGGLYVHLASGISGLVAAIILGSRVHFDPDATRAGQTNLSFTLLGTGLLSVGWIGFTGGSTLSANGIASLAILNTNVSAASSMLIWIILDLIVGKSRGYDASFISIPGICSAAVIGFVVITPAAGFVQPGYALLMGSIGGFLIYIFLTCKKQFFHIDDTLDVFSCHGLGGFIGTILTGLFCQQEINNKGANGAFYGNPIQFLYQIMGVVITVVYSAVCTAVILLPMHFTIGIRLHRLAQVRGLDKTSHGVIEHNHPRNVRGIRIFSVQSKSEVNKISMVSFDKV